MAPVTDLRLNMPALGLSKKALTALTYFCKAAAKVELPASDISVGFRSSLGNCRAPWSQLLVLHNHQ